MKKIFPLIIIIQVLFASHNWGQSNAGRLKALWIIENFASNVNWTEEELIDQFTIGVYDKSPFVYKNLIKLSKTSSIKGKKFKVVRFNSINNVSYSHILFVGQSYSNEVSLLSKEIKKNTLLITDQCADLQHCMLNFLNLEKGYKKFEFNNKNAAKNGITFQKNILVHGSNIN